MTGLHSGCRWRSGLFWMAWSGLLAVGCGSGIRERHTGFDREYVRTAFVKYVVSTRDGDRHGGRIVGLHDDSLILLPWPYWNSDGVEIEVDRITRIVAIHDKSDASEVLAALFGAVATGSLGLMLAGAIGMKEGTYKDDYEGYQLLSGLTVCCAAPLGGVIGYLGGLSASQGGSRAYNFESMTASEELALINRIAALRTREIERILDRSHQASDRMDDPGAFGLFRAGCALVDEESCYRLGLCHKKGLHTPPNPVRAAEIFDKLCQRGFAGGCHQLGLLHLQGAGVEQDKSYAKVLFVFSCEHGIEQACAKLEETNTTKPMDTDAEETGTVEVESKEEEQPPGKSVEPRTQPEQEPGQIEQGARSPAKPMATRPPVAPVPSAETETQLEDGKEIKLDPGEEPGPDQAE